MSEITQPPAAAEYLNQSSKHAISFFSELRRLIGDEIRLTRDEIIDQARTETEIFNDLVSKLAEAHSAHDLRTAYELCSQHQVDLLQRNSERLFQHVRRSISATSKLFEAESRV